MIPPGRISMKHIFSTDNPLIKTLSLLKLAKHRKKTGLYMAEGEMSALEAVRRNVRPRQVLFTENYTSHRTISELQNLGAEMIQCTDTCYRKFSNTHASEGIAMVLDIPSAPDTTDFPRKGAVVCAYQVQDPGNMGTLIRTAEALGAAAFLSVAPCADTWNPKVVRSSSGSVLSFPVFSCEWDRVLEMVRSASAQVLAGIPSGGESLEHISLSEPVVVMTGNEARGIDQAALPEFAQHVSIPISNGVESLNASVAGAIMLYEVMKRIT